MSSYYHPILARARTAYPSLLADESLFQALLLALVAKNKNVVVRTTDDAKQLLLTQVVNILHLLFDLSVVKLRLRKNDKLTPDDFLNLLFLDNPVHARAASRTSSRRTLNAGGNNASTFRRSSSYPSPSRADEAQYASNDLYSHLEKSDSEHAERTSSQNVMLHGLSRAQTDPTPLWHDIKVDETARLNLFPGVLVVSGLEHVSEEVQCALWTAISERRVSLGNNHHDQRINKRNSLSEEVWPVPADFFVVYVCTTGTGFDRPLVHKSLVDRFAMSVEAYPLVDAPLDSRMPPPISPTGAETASLRSVLSPLELADLRVLAGPTHTIIGTRAELYLLDLFSAVRHHPHLDGMLITARCRAETLELLRAWRVLFGPPPENLRRGAPFLDVTDEDVRNVFAIAVQHRVSVLEGPRHEVLASLVFAVAGVGGPEEEEEWETGRRTVKEILKEIVDTV